jgi:hypothetical protein
MIALKGMSEGEIAAFMKALKKIHENAVAATRQWSIAKMLIRSLTMTAVSASRDLLQPRSAAGFMAAYAPPDELVAAQFLNMPPRSAQAERQIDARAKRLIEAIRARKIGLGGVDDFLHAYSVYANRVIMRRTKKHCYFPPTAAKFTVMTCSYASFHCAASIRRFRRYSGRYVVREEAAAPCSLSITCHYAGGAKRVLHSSTALFFGRDRMTDWTAFCADDIFSECNTTLIMIVVSLTGSGQA